MRLAITCFTATGSETKVVSGPEPFQAAKEKLRAAMANKMHEPGVMEIWTSDGISDRFAFKGEPAAAETVPAVEPEPIEPEPEPIGFESVAKKRRR